jgi:hypothetical protein
MLFAQKKKRITLRASSFVHSSSTVAVVHLTLGMRALSAPVSKLAIWQREERKNVQHSHSAVSITSTGIEQGTLLSDFLSC